MKLAAIYRFPTVKRRRAGVTERAPRGPRTLSSVPGFLAAASVARELRPDIPRWAIAAAGRVSAPPRMASVDVAAVVAAALDSLGAQRSTSRGSAA